jgi:hypothetical protein
VESFPTGSEAPPLVTTTPLGGSSTLAAGPWAAKTTDRPSGYRNVNSKKAMLQQAPVDVEGNSICPGCGNPLTKDNVTRDHYPPLFKRLVSLIFPNRKVFLDNYNTGIRPLCNTCNSSHKYEDTPTDDLPYSNQE